MIAFLAFLACGSRENRESKKFDRPINYLVLVPGNPVRFNLRRWGNFCFFPSN
mgnify:CR=1 FL=1